jgi:hypothetical protein
MHMRSGASRGVRIADTLMTHLLDYNTVEMVRVWLTALLPSSRYHHVAWSSCDAMRRRGVCRCCCSARCWCASRV